MPTDARLTASPVVCSWRRRHIAVSVLATVLVLLSISFQALPQPAQAAATIPAGLPQHFALGLASGPDDLAWMTASGVPWDMRYQYLAGGANTGWGWATWNENGNFATYYMQASSEQGYLPVFTYYQLLQSTPKTSSNEAEQNYNLLNNASTMRAYFADFRLLLDRVRAYGKPVLIHVEPDLFGYMHQRVVDGTNSAASISAKVNASGHPDTAGLPDTFQGFNWALLRMREKYAPNAIMAAHVSHWSTKIDIGTDKSATLDVDGIGRKTAAFHNTAGIAGNPDGISGYDLLFFDPADRDAAYYQHVWNDGGAHWWDETNQRFPNFERYREYIKYVTDGTGRRAMLWQVPIGNTYFRTVNNTDGHYQDNKAQYFLGNYPNDGHIASYANAGVIGILFGRGAGGPTTYNDAKGDGITNPAPINGNNAVSQHADDDGGYLRIFGGRYYQAGAYRFDTTAPAPTPTPTVYMPQILSLEAVADTYVSAKYKSKNYGKATALNSDGSPVEQSFIRFDTGSFSGSVAAARLRLYVTNGSSAASGTVRQMSNTGWSETGVTYNNRPPIDGVQVGSMGNVAAGKWIEFDITAVVTKPGVYSFGIRQTGGDNVKFASRQATTAANRPQLVITLQ